MSACAPECHPWGEWFTITGGSPAYVDSYQQMRRCVSCKSRQFRSVDRAGREVAGSRGAIHPPLTGSGV